MSNPEKATSSFPASTELNGLALAGVVGSELARHTRLMDRELQELRRFLTRDQSRPLRHAVAGAQLLAMRAQQIARLAEGRLRQSHERLHLDDVVRTVVQERQAALRSQHVLIEHHLGDVEVIVDPGLLVNLVDTALDWAAAEGNKLQVWLEMRNWPEHALLTFKISTPIDMDDSRDAGPLTGLGDMPESIAWCLVLQLARAMGVLVEKFHVPGQLVLQLEFPRTVRKLEGLTAIEVDVAGPTHASSDWQTSAQPLAGHRALLITGDAGLKEEVAKVCKGMGMTIDCSPTVRQAVRSCELDMPHVILIDERLRDAPFEELRLDIQRHDVNFPFIEIAQENNVFEVSSWIGDAMSRLSRDTVAYQLAPVMAMELAKVI